LEKKNAFVIMPFNDAALNSFYEDYVKSVLIENGYDAKRSDEMTMKDQIIERIVHSIEDSDLIVCDLTNLNPNVMYELGIAHSLTRKVIMIARQNQNLPFDLSVYEVLFYDPSGKRFKKSLFYDKLVKAIDEVNKEGISNPVQKFSRINNELMNVSVDYHRPIIPPLKVFQKIGPYIREDFESMGQPYGIAITGASCIGKTTFAKELSKYLKENPHAEYFLLDGGHKTTAATLSHSLIPVWVIEKDQDFQEAKKLIKTGELFGWYKTGETVKSALDELAKHHFGTKNFLTVEDKTKVMVKKRDIPDYMISTYKRKIRSWSPK